MLHEIMQSDAVYRYPIWAAGLSMAAGAVFGSLLLHFSWAISSHRDTRRRHNDVTGSVISTVGVVHAVLLAFVAMLAWENDDAY